MQDLYGNIVLSGGTSMFPGMADRMSKEVRSRYSRASGALLPRDGRVSCCLFCEVNDIYLPSRVAA